jgi:hypothetical protein
MAKELKTIETAVSFIPAPYGTFFKVFVGLISFSNSFGRPDPLVYALARLQEQINELAAALREMEQTMSIIARRIAELENGIHVSKAKDISRAADRIALQLKQRPTDTNARELLAHDASAMVDRFLLEPDLWLWTDIEVIRRYDDYDRFVPPELEKLLDPDFKVHIALPLYAHAIMLLLAAIDLDTMGESARVQQRYGKLLERHITAVSSRPGWKRDHDQAVTLAEMTRKRIICRPHAQNKYAAEGKCVLDIICENVMERRNIWMHEVTVTGYPAGHNVFCTVNPSITDFDQEDAENTAGVMVFNRLGEMMDKVLNTGSLREPYIGRFSMAPTLPLAVLYGVTHSGAVEWYRQMPAEGQQTAASWMGPRHTREGWSKYIKVFPAGGNVFYALDTEGHLDWFAHDDFNDGGASWTGPKRVGHGWGSFLSITPGGDGVLYAVQPDGTLLWYRHDGLTSGGDAGTWRSNSLRSGFQGYRRLFSGGGGVLYAVDGDGKLWWFLHKGFKDGKKTWEGPRLVGNGWQNFRDVFGTDDGVIYAQQADGTLLRYIHDGWKRGTTDWRPHVPVSFGVGGYKQVLTIMSREPDVPR